jgi:hypothetical protein
VVLYLTNLTRPKYSDYIYLHMYIKYRFSEGSLSIRCLLVSHLLTVRSASNTNAMKVDNSSVAFKDMNPNSCPPMDCEHAVEGRRSSGLDPQDMTWIQPTDIMLGRGPTFYNNPGNRVLRKLVKEHVVHYKNDARRRDKAALVQLLVSKLQSMSYRFLHRSSTGIWVEAPAKVVAKKVGHGLRDARLVADKNGGDVNVLWKNFRPAVPDQTSADQGVPVVTEKVEARKETRNEEPENTTVITTGGDAQCNAVPAKLLQKNLSPLVPSTSVFDLHQGSENAGLSPFDQGIEEVLEHWDCDGNVKSTIDPWHARPVSFCDSEIEHRLEFSEQGAVHISETAALPSDSPSDGTAGDAHVVDAVDVALSMYARLFYEDSFDDFLACDPSQSLGRPVQDGQSLCRWFKNLS